MITMQPITVRGAMLTSSTIPFPDTGETAWATSTGYVVGDTVSYTIGTLDHKFQCKSAHTSDSDKVPEAYPDDETNTYWTDLGAVNKYAMFQIERNTQSVETSSPLTVEVDPGDRVGAIGIGNIIADDVTLEIYDSSPALVSTETKELLVRYPTNWYEYFYKPFSQINSTLFKDLPLNTTHTFKLIFTKSSGDIKVGSVVPGVPFDIGSAQASAKIRQLNFSTFTRSFDGEVKITPRRSIPKQQLKLHVSKASLNAVRRLINEDLNGVVTVWAGLVEVTDGYFESLFIIGICKDIEFSLDLPEDCFADIEIEGI